MPRRKPKPERVVEERIKESLDAILSDDEMDFEGIGALDLPRIKTTDIMNFHEATQTTGSDANGLMDSIVKFYLDENLIDEPTYINYKKKIDSMHLASMMLQLKTAQHSIIKLQEEIDLGNTNVRLFEVLAQLQSQIMQMPKDYQAYADKMEEGYKRIQVDMEAKNKSGSVRLEVGGNGENVYNPVIDDNGGIKVRGTKGLMEGLRSIISSEIQDVDPEEIDNEEIDEGALVNARKKAELNLDRSTQVSEENLDIDDELFE